MYLKYVCILGYICLFGLCNAQQVVSTGGFEIKSDVAINWIIGGDLANIITVDKSANQIMSDEYSPESENILKIYPIPAKEFIMIESHFSDTGKVVIDLYDNQGKKLLCKSLNYIPYLQVNISEIPAGIYILKFFLANKPPFFRKIIKN